MTRITANAYNLIVRGDYTFIDICKDIKSIIVKSQKENNEEMFEHYNPVQRQIEEIEPKTYTKENALKVLNQKSVAIKWSYIVDNDNNPGLAIVLKNEEKENEI